MRTFLWILFALALGCGSSNGSPQPVCHDEFNRLPDGSFPVVPCCPAQPPDCSGVADGTVSLPGEAAGTYCATTKSDFCFCACHGSTWQCNLDSTVTPGGGVCGS